MDTLKITSIDELIRRLDLCTGDYCYLDQMSHIDIPETELERYYSWNDDHYTRNLLVRNDRFELVLICWEKGQQSAIHDYNTKEAFVHPVRGKLREERFVKDEQTGVLHRVSNMLLGPREFSYLCHPVDIHRYTNVYESRSASLHLYAKPVSYWTLYNDQGEVWWDKTPEVAPQNA